MLGTTFLVIKRQDFLKLHTRKLEEIYTNEEFLEAISTIT